MKKLVSVIIPVYNVEKYLVKCLDSVRAQTYRNLEILLIDDGSQDGSAALCDCFQKIDERIRVIHKENGGLSSARNAGLDEADGEYVYFLDSDDYIEPQLLEKTVKALEETGNDWCGFWAVREDEQGHEKYRISFETDEWNLSNEEERFTFFLEKFLNYRVGWECCFHLYRREIIEKKGLRFCSEKRVFAEDLLFSFCYLLYAERGLCIPEVFYHYVERKGSLLMEKADVNILPCIQELICLAYENVCKSSNHLLEKQFSLIAMALLEWHVRKYIASNGISWVRENLEQVDVKKFLPFDRREFAKLYQEGMAAYGRFAGVISVILLVKPEDEEKEVERYISSILSQSIQRLDVLILKKEKRSFAFEDCRIRQIETEDLSSDEVLRLGFQKSFGEYIYFADVNRLPTCTFLEQLSDAMKYNRCDTGVDAFVSKETVVFDHRDPECRRRIRQNLKGTENSVIFRKDLLQKSGLGHIKNLYQYRTEMILSGDVIFLQTKEEITD